MPKTRKDRLFSAVMAFCLSVVFLMVGIVPAYAGYQNLGEVPSDVKDNIKQAMSELVTKRGFTPEAAAGVLGNVNQESEFKPDLIERNSNTYKPQLESDPCKMTREEGTGGIGYFQLDGSRRTDMFCWIHKQGKKWDDLPSQIEYALVEDFKVEDPFKNPTYVNRIMDPNWAYCSGAKIDCSNAPTKKFDNGLEDVKKLKDPKMVAVIWAAVWERCSSGSLGHLPLRATMAQEIFDEFGASAGSPGGGTSSGDTDNSNLAATTGGQTGPVDEEDLTGMPDQPSWNEPENMPEDSKYQNLSTMEKYNLTAIHDNIVDGQEYGPVRFAQVAIVMFGLGLILWSLLLLGAILFDRTNVFFEFSMVRLLSLGRMEYTHDPSSYSKTVMSGKKIALRAGIGIILGLVIISGAVFGWLSMLLVFLYDKG